MHQSTSDDAAMRTTITLDDEIHQRLLSHARDSGKTLSETMERLLRDAMNLEAGASARATRVDAVTLLPVIDFGRAISLEDVRSLDDDA
jgi:macrodomain Ter protein organizer (MatP/YcbG family)